MLWSAGDVLGTIAASPIGIPKEEFDVLGEEIKPGPHYLLGVLGGLLVRTDPASPSSVVRQRASEYLKRSRSRRTVEPVRVGPVPAHSTAEAVLVAGRTVRNACEGAFGCRELVRIVSLAFPRDVAAEPSQFHTAVVLWRAAREHPDGAPQLISLVTQPHAFLRRLFHYPILEALDAVRVAPLCQWLWDQFGAINTHALKVALDLEFANALADPLPAHLSGEASETKAGAPEKMTAGVDKQPQTASPNLFARIPGDRYRIAYADREEPVPMLAGLRVVEYLLKQPGTAAHVLDINRALCGEKPRAAGVADVIARAEGVKGLDGFTADALRQPDPCSDEDLESAKEAVKAMEEQAEKAREGGEHDKADELEHKAETARGWIRREETLIARKRRGQPDKDSEVDKVRSKHTNNVTNALEKLRTKYGLPELAAHLDEQIDRGAEWKYRPVPGVEWVFTLGRR
jgi:hypothetical protein